MAVRFGRGGFGRRRVPPAADAKDEKGKEKEQEPEEEEEDKKKVEEEDHSNEAEPDLQGFRSRFIRHNMAQLRKEGKYCDVTLVVGSERKRFPAHKTILALRSSYFAAMFYSRWAESKMEEVDIKDVSAPVFDVCIEFMYSDRALVDSKNAMEVLLASKKFQIDGLSKKCAVFIQQGVTVENACELYASRLGLLSEEDGALTFLEDNMSDIVKTKGFLLLNKEHILTLLKSNFLAIDEADLFSAIVKWAQNSELPRRLTAHIEKQHKLKQEREALEKKAAEASGSASASASAAADGSSSSASASSAAVASSSSSLPASAVAASPMPTFQEIMAELLPFIRFPCMELESFAAVVPATGLLPAEHQLKLFQMLADKDRADTGKDKLPKEDWFCASCTYYNSKTRATCEMCQSKYVAKASAAPEKKKEEPPAKEWTCPQCTYMNGPIRLRCEICNEKMPAPPPPSAEELKKKAEEEKKAKEAEEKKGALVYSSVPREPRRPDPSKMRFLLVAGNEVQDIQDVQQHVIDAFKKQYKGKRNMPVVDAMRSYQAPQMKVSQLLTYDCVMVWWGSYNHSNNIGDVLAQYSEKGGSVVVCVFDMSNNTLGRFSRENFWPIVPGAQGSNNPLTSVLGDRKRGGDDDEDDGKQDLKAVARHPLLSHFKRLAGGQYSYFCQIRPRAKNVNVLASWSNGTPLVLEGPAKGEKKNPPVICLNFYPVSSRRGQGMWDATTDGHHLLLNALVYGGAKSKHKREKLTGANKIAGVMPAPGATAARIADEPDIDDDGAGMGMGLFD